MKITFDQTGDFAALDAAEAWCKERGISVGTMQADAPIGLKYGDFRISKWRNLSKEDIEALDGTITGDKRNGPVHIEMKGE